MKVTINGVSSTDIDNEVMKRILNIYPEEELLNRAIFQESLTDNSIEFNDLIVESEKILIPWQMFFLSLDNLLIQLKHIDNERIDKVSSKLMAKRKGAGDVTSKRIIDRLIRQQNFINRAISIPKNKYCGSLKGVSIPNAVNNILSFFDINYSSLWKYKGKGSAFEYLVNQIEAKNINVSRAVLVHKILPHYSVVPGELYKNTSGFVIRDECIPFVFLPSEINPDEVESRQIYTLIYLLVIIGLDQYDYYLESDFKSKIAEATGVSARIHAITSELLMPREETDKLRSKKITNSVIDELTDKLKVSPLALVTTLRMRGIITEAQFLCLRK
jgi:hypothetical protein